MNKNKDYELQCLLELLSAVVNNDSIPDLQNEPDWGKLYKLADYHHVANVLYGPVISMSAKGLLRWRSMFEERFHYTVIAQERYQNAEKEVTEALESAKIHIMELEETILRNCYDKREQRYPAPLRFLIEAGKSETLTQVMKKLDFEEKAPKSQNVNPGDRWFYKSSGIYIVFIEKIEFTNKKTTKYFSLPPKPFKTKKGSEYQHMQDANDFYLYYIALLAERYARGYAEIRDMLDLWQCYLRCYERLDWKEINKELKRLEIDWFGEMIVKLAAMWFGQVEDFGEDLDMLRAMETYITSKGTEAREENEQLLPLVKEVADIYARDLKREKRRELIELWFPDRDYMETIYPALEKSGYLLPICWIRRLTGRQWRKVKYSLLRRFINTKHALGKKKAAIKAKFSFIQPLKEKFKKKKEPGNNT